MDRRPLPVLAALVALVLALATTAAIPAPAVGDPKPARGRVLVASHHVTGPFFAESVVLLLDYAPGGAIGLVVNRPLEVGLSQLLPDLDGTQDTPHRAWLGGPVRRDSSVMALVRARAAPDNSAHVVGDAYVTTSGETLREALASDITPRHLRVFLGYAGWGAGQLDAELARGDWRVIDAPLDLIFGKDPTDMWRDLRDGEPGIRVRAPLPASLEVVAFETAAGP